MAFFRTPGYPLLYSGVTMTMASARCSFSLNSCARGGGSSRMRSRSSMMGKLYSARSSSSVSTSGILARREWMNFATFTLWRPRRVAPRMMGMNIVRASVKRDWMLRTGWRDRTVYGGETPQHQPAGRRLRPRVRSSLVKSLVATLLGMTRRRLGDTLLRMGGQLDFTFQGMAAQRRVWAVRELMSAVRTALEREYTDVWVEGEISNFRPAESGHLYFTLKDGDAQLRLVMFRTQARLLRFKPENGMHVVARGRVTVYEARGELQLSAEYLEPKGAGALQVAFEQLKAKLAEEGLFDAARKKPMPAMPKRIGIVTSPRGAAIQDMINILRRRHAGVNVLIYPAQVQGDYAATEVASGVKYFNRAKNVDVI